MASDRGGRVSGRLGAGGSEKAGRRPIEHVVKRKP